MAKYANKAKAMASVIHFGLRTACVELWPGRKPVILAHRPDREPRGCRIIRGVIRKALLAVAFVAVARYYLWAVQATGDRFVWDLDSGGYCNYLARGLAAGNLYLPIEPAPQLLAAADPWDPSISAEYKMHDMAFYKGRYYLYHGAGPAVLLFVPWRLVTGHDLPERFAVFLFCSGGLVFACLTLLRIFDLAGVTPSAAGMAAIPLVAGLCQAVPFLLNRAMVYETAIAGGYFCLSAAFHAFARGFAAPRSGLWFCGAGLMFGWAIACRPHLGLAGVVAILAVIAFRRRDAISIAAPFAALGLLVAAYNYARFDDPFEFGIRYLFSGDNQNRIRLSAANLIPSSYLFLVSPPDFRSVFPWVHTVLRHPPGGFPPGYVVEAVTGAFYLAPFLPAALWVRREGGTSSLLVAVMAKGALGILLFHLATGWTTQRYAVDFLPILVLAAVANLGIRISQQQGWRRNALIGAAAILAAFGIFVNLALGITGPYDDMLRNRPANWVRLAKRFTIAGDDTPLLKPRVEVSFTAHLALRDEGTSEPLLTIGRIAHGYFVTAEQSGKAIRIVSHYEGSKQEAEIAAGAHSFAIRLDPVTSEATVTADGTRMLTHRLATWVTSRSQVEAGVNRADPWRTAARFSGVIERVQVLVSGN